MHKRPTRKDVAKLAGVSSSTVHYTFNEELSKRITPATREKVEKAAKELGYILNRTALALKSGKFNTIGVLLWDIRTPYEQMLIGYLQRLIHKMGYDTMIADGYDSKDKGTLQNVLQWPVDGLILFWSPENNIEIAKQYNKPIVCFGDVSLENVDMVLVNHYKPSCEVVEHLVKQSCNSIGFLKYSNSPETDARIQAYKHCACKYNILEQFFVIENIDRHHTYEQCKELFAIKRPPQGIFCLDDDGAIALQRALRDLGYKMPEDVAIVGCDGILETDYTYPRITTITNPVKEICESLVNLLARRIKEPESEYRVIELEEMLEIRESSLRKKV